jgi:hypothetical protein
MLESKMYVHDGAIHIILAGNNTNSNYKLPINDILI